MLVVAWCPLAASFSLRGLKIFKLDTLFFFFFSTLLFYICSSHDWLVKPSSLELDLAFNRWS